MWMFVPMVFLGLVRTQPILSPASRPLVPPYSVPAGKQIEDKPTGFFHTKQIEGRWWFIDPKGCLFYAVGTDHISYRGHWCEKLGYHPYERNNDRHYGSEEKWAASTSARLARWGFNTLAWGHTRRLRHGRFAHIESMTIGSSFAGKDALCPQTHWTGFPNVFSPEWPKHCDEYARRACAPIRDDPWLIGYFLDNELEWFGKDGKDWGLFDEVWKLPPDHTAKRAWLAFLEAQVGTAADFERGWGVKLSALSDLARHTDPAYPRTQEARDVAARWVREVAQRYFEGCTSAIRAHDGNHLVLGCRFAGAAPGVWNVAGRYCDVVSVNQYAMVDVLRGVPDYLVERLTQWHREAGKPLMLTEWSFPAYDTELPSTVGAGMRVDTQAQRAACFRHYQTLLFTLPFMVGSSYFMWVDEPALGISSSFAENSNYGLVNEDDEPYRELTGAAARLNPLVYMLREAAPPSRPSRAGPIVDWLRTPPERSVSLSAGPIRLSVGDLDLEGPVDGRAWKLSTGGVPLGELHPVVHQPRRPSMWTSTDRGRVTSIRRDSRVMVVEMELAGEGRPPSPRTRPAGADAPAPPWRFLTGWRFWIPSAADGPGWFASECLWVENTDSEPWPLEAVYYYLRPTIGGAPENDEALDLGAAHYYRRGGAWIDREAHVGVGSWFPAAAGFEGWYWKDDDGHFHPDLFRRMRQVLEPGRRVAINELPAFFFTLRDLTRAGFAGATWQIERTVLTPP